MTEKATVMLSCLTGAKDNGTVSQDYRGGAHNPSICAMHTHTVPVWFAARFSPAPLITPPYALCMFTLRPSDSWPGFRRHLLSMVRDVKSTFTKITVSLSVSLMNIWKSTCIYFTFCPHCICHGSGWENLWTDVSCEVIFTSFPMTCMSDQAVTVYREMGCRSAKSRDESSSYSQRVCLQARMNAERP